MPTKQKLKRYELTINPDADMVVSAISIVKTPATLNNFKFFSFNKPEYNFEEFATDDELMEMWGVAMMPDTDIIRQDKDGTDCLVWFSKETVRDIAQNYMKNGFQNNMNIQHSALPADTYVFQALITDKKRNVVAPMGIKCPEGTWLIGTKCENRAVWNEIKNHNLMGFSIEGDFVKIRENNFSIKEDNKVNVTEVEDDIVDYVKQNRMKHNFSERIRLAMAATEPQILSEDAVKIDDKSVGSKVELVQTDGSLAPAPDGVYQVNDFTFTVKDSVIASIEGQAAPEEVKTEAAAAPTSGVTSGETAVSAATQTSEAAPTEAPKADATNVDARLTALEDAVNQIIAILKEGQSNMQAKFAKAVAQITAKQEGEVNVLKEKFNKLLNEPATPEPAKKKTSAVSEKEARLHDTFSMLIANRKK